MVNFSESIGWENRVSKEGGGFKIDTLQGRLWNGLFVCEQETVVTVNS
jgi:hypothetical protein